MSLRNFPALLALLCAGNAVAAQCSVGSAPERTPLVELYTSEGCSSCPPADRWLSRLKARGIAPHEAVALAFHVDYWDYIGWADRFADPRNGARQREKVAAAGGRTVYTPQIMVNGRDSRAWRGGDPLAGTARSQALADIALLLEADADGQRVQVRATAPAGREARLIVARYENGHESDVKAGENRGETLAHDFVVREWQMRAIPPEGALEATLHFAAGERPGGVAAFVEDTAGGEVLQAVALPACSGG